jgi:ligand-binding sensor domain-containing protein/signal transduction histidine kinase
MNKIYGFIKTLCIFIMPFIGHAQTHSVYFDRLSIDDGLSQSSVYAIFKDSKGFLWLGTAEGLNRFDGFKFTVYKVNPDEPGAISDSWITCIYEDSNQNLWIGTHDGGLNLFNYDSEKFTCFRHNPQNPNTLSNNTINALCEDRNGYLWIATNSGLNYLEINKINAKRSDNITFNRIQKNEQNLLPSNHIISLSITHDNELWLGTNAEGFAKMVQNQNGKQKFQTFKFHASKIQTPTTNQVWAICEDKLDHNILWVANSSVLQKFNKKSEEFEPFKFNLELKNLRKDLRTLLTDSNGDLWIGTMSSGLFHLEAENNKIKVYKNNIFDNSSLSKNNILCIYEDNEGILWIGTKGGGLNKRRKNQFSHFKNLPGNPGTLSANSIWSVYKDRKGTIWIGTEQGLNMLSENREKFITFTNIPNNPGSLSDNSVYCIFEDSQNNFWIGTSNGGLNLFDRKSGKFKHHKNNPLDKSSLSYDYVKTMAEDKYGRLWIGTRGGGLNLFDKKTGNFRHFIHDPGNDNSLSNNRINALLFDKKGILWIATSGGGLNSFDPESETFKRFAPDSTMPNSIKDLYVMAVCEDKAGNLWVGTYDRGLNLFDRKNESFISYTEKDGLPNNVIYGIIEDSKGKIWVSTNKGLSCFDPKTKIFENYDVSDGLQDNEFNTGACFASPDGELLFGGINGFNVFRPELIRKNKVIPPIALTDFKIINKKVIPGEKSPLKESIITAREINLSYKDYIFSIEFVALSLLSPGKNKYSYKLEGFDNEWIPTDYQNRVATYTNLEGGTYTFRLRASNNDGIWNEEGISVNIIIHPPFWKTWWFRLGLMITLLTGLFAFYRWRVNTLRKQKNELENIVSEKTKEIRYQKEELEAVNEELTDSNEELHNQREELEKALQHLQDTQIKLIQSEKMASLGILAAGVAHEINNPLNFIQSGVEGLEEYFNQNLKEHLQPVSPFIYGINTGVSRASSIILSLRQYSHKSEEIKNECDLLEIIDNCLIILQNLIKGRIEIQKHHKSENVKIIANSGKLHQAFLNILSNSIQSIEKEGVIKIFSEIKGQNVLIRFQDNGSGIDPEVLPKIFDPFFTTKQPGKGTGLGLSITYKIIEELGGNIKIESEFKKGTIVEISIPYEK